VDHKKLGAQLSQCKSWITNAYNFLWLFGEILRYVSRIHC